MSFDIQTMSSLPSSKSSGEALQLREPREGFSEPEDSLLVDKKADTSSTRVILAPVSKEEREGFLRDSNLKTLQSFYLEWVNNNVFMGLKLRITHIPTSKSESRLIFVLAAKRGNKKYADKLQARVRDFNETLPDTQFFNPSVRKTQTTPMFKVTMTCDPKVVHSYSERDPETWSIVWKSGRSRYAAWAAVGHELNKFRSNLRKYFGCEISIIHTWEDFKKEDSSAYGYPHINLVVLLGGNIDEKTGKREPYKQLKTFFHNGEWRLSCKRDLEAYWHSHIDVKAVSRIGKFDEEDHPDNDDSCISLSHNLKYITKDLRQCREGDDYILLNAILWAMRKRAFSMNGDFLERFEESCERLDQAEANSNFPELELAKNPDYLVEFMLMGVFPGCIFKCIKGNRGKIPDTCPYYRFANLVELRENWGLTKQNCHDTGQEDIIKTRTFTAVPGTGLNYDLLAPDHGVPLDTYIELSSRSLAFDKHRKQWEVLHGRIGVRPRPPETTAGDYSV